MVKLTAGCADCGYDKHPQALDFDHVCGVKHREVSQMVLSNWDNIFSEIEKCEVLCANCHRIRTHERSHLRAVG